MPKIFSCLCIAFLLIFLLCGISIAQEQKTFAFSHKIRYIRKSDLKHGTGDFSLSRSQISLNSTYSLFQKIPVKLGIGLEQFNINNHSDVDLPDTLQSKNLKIGFRFPMSFTENNDLFLGFGILPSWNSASDHSLADEAFGLDYSASVIFLKSEKFITACGVWLRPGYKNSLIPYFGFRYKPNERLTLNFLSSEPSIAYSITDQTKVLLEFAFLSKEFDVTSGARRGDVVRISDLEAGVGLEHAFNESFKGKLSLGLAFDQRYEYLDANQKVSPKNSLYGAYKFNLRF